MVTVTIKIGEKEITLDVEELLKLRDELTRVFGPHLPDCVSDKTFQVPEIDYFRKYKVIC